MTQQIAKKWLGDNEVGSDKILLEKDKALMAIDQSDAEVELLKIDTTGKAKLLGHTVLIDTDLNDLDVYAQDIRSDLDQEIIDRAAGDAAAQTYADNLADRFVKEGVTLSSGAVSDGYLSLSYKAAPNSLTLFIGRLALLEGASFDYTLSVEAGVTKISFTASYKASEEYVEAGERLTASYFKDIR